MKPGTAQALYRQITQLAVRIARIRHPLSDADARYRRAWDVLRARPWMTRLATHCENPFQLLPEEMLAASLARHLNSRKKPYLPRISPATAEDAAMLKGICSGAIVVSLHSGRPYTTELLLRAGLPVSLLSAAPRRSMQRLYPELRVLSSGATSLARIRQELRNGRIVSCAVDQRRNNQGQYSLVNPGIFELARRLDAPVHFTSSSVSTAGEILKHISAPHYVRDTQVSVNAFIEYYNAHRRLPKRLEHLTANAPEFTHPPSGHTSNNNGTPTAITMRSTGSPMRQ